ASSASAPAPRSSRPGCRCPRRPSRRPGRRTRTGTGRGSDAGPRDEVAVFSHFFIHRPIFAVVLSVVITLAGGIAVFTLPIAQYPQIMPATIQSSAAYPGANAVVVSETVAAPIEQQVNGVEGMMY